VRLEIVSALADRSYRAVALGNAVSMVGIWMQKVAVGWLAWDLSQSTAWLGAVAAADLMPAVLLSSLSGSLADGRNKAGLIMVAQLAAMVQSLVLGVLTIAGLLDIWILFFLTLALGVANSIDQPSRLSLLREIVAREHLGSAVTLNALSFHLARFVAPMIAGVLIVKVEAGVTILVTAATLGFFALCLATIRRRPLPPAAPRAPMLAATFEGYRYVVSNRAVRRALMIMVTFGVAVGGVNQLLPALADRLFGRGIQGFVELTASSALGAVGAAIVLLVFPPRPREIARNAACLIVAAAALAAFVATPNYWVGVAALFVASFCSTYSGVMTQAGLNAESQPDMLGRVMGVYSALVRGAPAAGGLAIGVVAPLTGFAPLIGTCAAWAAIYGLLLLRGRRH
jgi:MFS family permease